MDLPCGVFSRGPEQDMAIVRTRTQWGLLIALLIFLFTLPLFVSTTLLHFATYVSITIIAVHGLNIITGYCGQISLGHAIFMVVGGTASGIFTFRWGLPYWVALPCAGLLSGAVGMFFGLPSVRIKGFYLALTTLAAHFIIPYVIVNVPGISTLSGAARGLTNLPRPFSQGIGFLDADQSYYLLVIVCTVLVTFFVKNLARTRAGRSFVAIRDNDIAAESVGINLFRYKLLAFFIGSFLAGIAGSLWCHYMGSVTPYLLNIMDSIWFMGMLIVGGLGSTTGVILGVLFLKGLGEIVTTMTPGMLESLPFLSVKLTISGVMMVYALVIILFLVFEPRGINHWWQRVKTSYRMWPFAY